MEVNIKTSSSASDGKKGEPCIYLSQKLFLFAHNYIVKNYSAKVAGEISQRKRRREACVYLLQRLWFCMYLCVQLHCRALDLEGSQQVRCLKHTHSSL